MKYLVILLLACTAALFFSCEKEPNPCPDNVIDIYKTGSVNVIIISHSGDITNKILSAEGNDIRFNACENPKSIAVMAREDNTQIRVNGGIHQLQNEETLDLLPLLRQPRD